jgi:ubiquitin carboxyl-terminal hydrolase 4/11/15
LAFLLDGLHEDLNRIKNPPYVEKPDVTNEQKLSIAGEESWDAHCLRNRSVVMDTFYGQFKSTCVCPRCERVSVSFDAFNHLSLEIPQRRNENTRIVAVLLFSTSSSEPIRYAITLSKNGRMFDIKANLSKITGLPIERIALCDIYDNSIYEIYQDNKNVSVIEKDDIVAAYEIDPYSTSIIHAISTHWKYKTLPQSEEENMTIQRRLIGYPMLSSFGIDLSCREVWHHYCRRMSYIFPEVEEEERLQLLKLRLVNANGKPIAVFGKSSSLEQEMNSIDSFSIIPQTDEKLASFLDNDCAESFLFISIEWNFSNESQNVVDEKRFNLFSNDSSVIEAIRKQQRSMNTNITLENCLEQFTLPEQLDEDNKWYCSACKKHVRAEKTMELWRLPNILIVHLKRFEFKHSLRREKLETLIDCPLEGLEMGKYCAPTSHDGDFAKQKEFVFNGVPACYDLFAVVNHYGRMGFGHYTAFARRWTEDTMSDDWALFDDSSVRACTKGQVVSSAAYVLFYRRRVFI